MSQLTTVDREVSARLAIPCQAHALRRAALAAAHSGDSLLWVGAATAAILWGNATWWGFGGRVLLGTLSAGAAATVLKWLFRRPRPSGERRRLYAQFDRHAFPSGHASRSACMVALLSPILPPWGSALLALWAGFAGLARVALQVHFLSDILVGWATGLLVGLALHAAL